MYTNMYALLISLIFYLQLPLQTAIRFSFALNTLCKKHFKIFSYKYRFEGNDHQQPPPNPRLIKIDFYALISILNLKHFTDPRIIFFKF